MASPVKAAEIKALIVTPQDDICDAIKKTFIQLPIIRYRLIKYMFKENADPAAPPELSDQFAQQICDWLSTCPAVPSGTTTTTTTTTTV